MSKRRLSTGTYGYPNLGRRARNHFDDVIKMVRVACTERRAQPHIGRGRS